MKILVKVYRFHSKIYDDSGKTVSIIFMNMEALKFNYLLVIFISHETCECLQTD